MEKLILVCDDDNSILEVTRTILETHGFKVAIALDCENIVEKVLQHRPDLILMDIWLPEHGGDRATIELKSDPATRDIPVLLFSAVNEVESIAQKCGADGWICKPFELEYLVEKIERQLDLHKPLIDC